VLFLDELPEFSYRVLEVMRQPMEEGRILLVRTARTHVFPARFQLVAAMNPCPCGFRGHPTRPCSCTALQVRRYTSRLSGPLLDRIDLHVEVPPVEVEHLEKGRGESSAAVADRVLGARRSALERNGGLPGKGGEPTVNAALGPADLRRLPRPTPEAGRLLRTSAERYALTARTWHRLLKVAWTIADLAGEERVGAAQISEALQYRVGRISGPLSRSGPS
jgi:magnesium chelatase family protein